ncbi:MAG: hypothetical protein CVU73_07435 [Deltaproteobacteria bacterium HGW-Deltaproteobacteria-8]|jgi:hypothetical protein|nr:MAG: hypothetical protein CVU73_07435 [Deltaproteobacteria bacterium HGW-Deltaproteobacteria-8]
MEVGWHLRLSRENELVFLVRAGLAPNVEDAVFISGDWLLAWEPDPENPKNPEHAAARVSRKQPRA